MAVSETLLNFRESSMPELRIDELGNRTFAKQYKATVQVLIEGSTPDFLTWTRSFFGDVGDGETSVPAGWQSVKIDDENDFRIMGDLHPDDISLTRLLFVVSELTGNYDKASSYGKMTGTYQLDITGPVLIINTETKNWELLEPVEY